MRGGGQIAGAPPAATALPEEIAANRDRCVRWATLCAAGRCQYATLPAHEEWPIRSGDTCPGYTGTLHAEEHGPVLRVRPCLRRAAWWQRRRVWLREQRLKRRREEE